MSALKARVQNGRLVLDEPTGLPDGTVVELVAVDAPDDMDDAERASLHAELEAGLRETEAGDTVDADEVLARLRAS